MAKHGELTTNLLEVKSSDFLVEMLWQYLYFTSLVVVFVFPKINLGQCLVSKAVGHHKAWVTCGTTKVYQATFCKHVEAVARWECVFVNLWLDVEMLNTLSLAQRIHLDLIIKVTNVTNDRLILHLLHMLKADDVVVTRGGDINISPAEGVLNGENTVTFHRCLQRTDRIDFSDHDLCPLAT